MENAFLKARCLNCHSMPKAECDITHRILRKVFIIYLHATLFSINPMKVFKWATTIESLLKA